MSQYIPNCEPCMYLFKTGKTPNWYGPTDEKTVWELKKEGVNNFHPTQKPIKLAGRAINNSSKKDDIVLDLFGGSGSTLIASEQLERTCYMMELDEKYCDVIIRRYIKYRLDNNKEVNIEVNGQEVVYQKYLVDKK
jgi:DNA modification methylase